MLRTTTRDNPHHEMHMNWASSRGSGNNHAAAPHHQSNPPPPPLTTASTPVMHMARARAASNDSSISNGAGYASHDGTTATRRIPVREMMRKNSSSRRVDTGGVAGAGLHPAQHEMSGYRQHMVAARRLNSFRKTSIRRMGSSRRDLAAEMSRQPSLRNMNHPPTLTSLSSSQRSLTIRNLEDQIAMGELMGRGTTTIDPNSKSQLGSGNDSYASFSSSRCPLSVIEFQPEQNFDKLEIEIAPGVYKRLVGSQETQTAWDNGQCVDAWCFACDTLLAVAPNCDCVICPLCHEVSPVFKDDQTTSQSLGSGDDSWWLTLDGGEAVGLGVAVPHG